ncbi:DUF295 domain-containing protein [Psidium guajava]|nr:DUF295 domain-containing protein [Psidium guajava]
MEGMRNRPWSDLQPELLSMISTRLHTRMDVLRFRSVCSSFRSSIPLPAPLVPLRIPCSPGPDLFLRESTVYNLEMPADGAASGRARWLAKLEESEFGDMRIRPPFGSLPLELPLVFDSLKVRIMGICREYTLGYGGGTGGPVRGMQKVVVHPDCVWTDRHRYVVYFIDDERKLCYWKFGDENRSHLGRGYEDIVVYQGKVCVVHKSGVVSRIDSSFKLQSFSPPIDGCSCLRRHLKHLVVSSGDLYAVARCFTHFGMSEWDFRVYRLDQQCGRWEEMRSLGNSAFFLCKFCSFAVSADELDWYEGDCIYCAKWVHSRGSWDKPVVFNVAERRREYPDFSGSWEMRIICGMHLLRSYGKS